MCVFFLHSLFEFASERKEREQKRKEKKRKKLKRVTSSLLLRCLCRHRSGYRQRWSEFRRWNRRRRRRRRRRSRWRWKSSFLSVFTQLSIWLQQEEVGCSFNTVILPLLSFPLLFSLVIRSTSRLREMRWGLMLLLLLRLTYARPFRYECKEPWSSQEVNEDRDTRSC